MKKKTKAVAFLIVISLITGGVSGCGDKADEIINDMMDMAEEDGSSDSSTGTLSAKLGVPSSYQGSLDTGESGLSSITIDLEDIDVTAVDNMSVVYCEKVTQDAEYKKQVCESIFDAGKGIYIYDEENQTADYYEEAALLYQEMADDAYAAGNEDIAKIYEEYIAGAEKNIETAPSERESAGDYSESSFLGYIGENQYVLSFFDVQEDGLGRFSNMSLSYYPQYAERGLAEYKSVEDSSSTYAYSNEYYEDEDMNNECTLSKNEAVSYGLDFFSDIGVLDIASDEIYDLRWTYDDSIYNTVETELDGYVISFLRYIDGALAYNGGMEADVVEDGEDAIYMYCPETYTMEIDSNGIVEVYCINMLQTVDEEDAELLSWSDLMDAMDENLSEYLIENPTGFSDLTYNNACLTYIKIKDENSDDGYIYIPAWYFSYVENDTLQYGFIVDARDGTIYSIQDVADRIF